MTRTTAIRALVLAVAWSTASCSMPAANSHPGGSSTATAVPTTRSVAICLGQMPSEWSAAGVAHAQTLPSEQFHPQAIDPNQMLAFGFFKTTSEKGVAEVNLGSGQSQTLTRMAPAAAGVVWMTYSDPWLAWLQADSQVDLGDWTVRAINIRTQEERTLASSRLANGGNTGALSFPVSANGYLAWSQPSANGDELVIYRFDTGQTSTIDTGRLSSPVIAGDNLIWAKSQAGDTEASFRIADAKTLQLGETPTALKVPREMQYLAGSSDYLVWTESSGSMSAYRFQSHQLSHYSIASEAMDHPFQFPTVGTHFVAWFTGSKNTVVDLDTGNGFDVDLPSGVLAADRWLLIGRIQGTKSGAGSTTLSTVDLQKVKGLTSCLH